MGLGINRGNLTYRQFSEVREKSWPALDSKGPFISPTAAFGRNQAWEMNTQRALSDQLSTLSFHRNFFAKCKEVTDKESISWVSFACRARRSWDDAN
jgi:hypothetical protein